LRMVELVVGSDPKFLLSRVDIDRKPPHYAVDTMVLLHDQAPDDDYYYLMGLDSLNDLLTWHQPTEFINQCQGIGVMLRYGEVIETSILENEITGIGTKLHYLKTPIIDISSSDIRLRAGSGRQFRYFVPEKVYQYILENKLYIN
jgi:nicotinate-nucleotide adenylyltransferase